MRVLLRGGPKDGLLLELPDDRQAIRIPFIRQDDPHGKVLTMEEWDDPANWEWDEFDGRWRIKRPKFHTAEYSRTSDIVDGAVVFA